MVYEASETIAARTVFYLAIFPTAFFFSAAYAEGLFLALSVASFYYARRRQWLLACLLCALGTATRPIGILLIPPLIYEYTQQRGFHWRRVICTDTLFLPVMPLGLLLYMEFLYHLTGDPLKFLHLQVPWDNWHKRFVPPWVLFWTEARELLTTTADFASYAYAHTLIDLAFAVVVLSLAILAFRHLCRSYAIYASCSILFIISTGMLISTPRYVAVVFPIFMVLAQLGQNRHVDRVIVFLSLSLQGLFAAMFALGLWVA